MAHSFSRMRNRRVPVQRMGVWRLGRDQNLLVYVRKRSSAKRSRSVCEAFVMCPRVSRSPCHWDSLNLERLNSLCRCVNRVFAECCFAAQARCSGRLLVRIAMTWDLRFRGGRFGVFCLAGARQRLHGCYFGWHCLKCIRIGRTHSGAAVLC